VDWYVDTDVGQFTKLRVSCRLTKTEHMNHEKFATENVVLKSVLTQKNKHIRTSLHTHILTSHDVLHCVKRSLNISVV